MPSIPHRLFWAVLSAVFALVFLKERLNGREWLGIGLVSFGIALLALKR